MQTEIIPGIKCVKQEYWDTEYQEFEEQKHILDEYHDN